MRARVVQLQLRGIGPAEALERAGALLANSEEPDLTRLLILDEARSLHAHQEAYEELLRSRFTDAIVSVAVGHGDGTKLELPGSLAQGAGVLWVLNPGGVNWRLAAGAPATRRDSREDRDTGLVRLVEVLTIPEVFDQAHRLLERIPGGVANPGHRLAGAGGGPSEFQLGLLAAIEQTLERRPGPAPAFGGFGRGSGASRPVEFQPGPFTRRVNGCAEALAGAGELAETLPEPSALLGSPSPVRELVVEAGEYLLNVREDLRILLDEAHSTSGLTAAQYETLTRAGIVPLDAEDFDATRTRTALDGYLREALDRETPLPKLSERLSGLADELVPRGSRAHTAALDEACPDSLLERLRSPEPFPGPEPWLPGVGLVAGALAGLTPFGPVSGAVMGVLWTLLVALTVVRGPGGGRAHLGLGLNAAAAVGGGVAAGVLVTGTSPALWPLALVGALAVAITGTLLSWRSRATHWAAEAGLAEAGRSLEELLSVLGRADREWAQATARLNTSDAVVRLRVALDRAAQELEARGADLRRELSGPPNPDPALRRQLGDLVLAVLEPRLRELSSGSPGEHGDAAARATEDLLRLWDDHVSEHGPIEPPPFAVDREPSVAANPHTEDLLRAAAQNPHDVMWQLCSADDLALLDPGHGQVPVVRFAPRSGLAAAAEGRSAAEMVWISSAQHAGVLRLVPIRPGMTSTSWTDEKEAWR
ncbi:hypothetical protein [Actinocorallia longicatena]|uniref:Uncharacterized protein n=1 Tax=Actinocorallia longicatena TaxID=111803 RepID=A0ABP6QHF5_9ACTN